MMRATLILVFLQTPFVFADEARMQQMASASAEDTAAAWKQMEAGKKTGHWVWWIFPTLTDHGGDRNSASVRTTCCGRVDADLTSMDEAVEYAGYKTLRDQLLKSFQIATTSFQNYNDNAQGPYNVLDKSLGRSAQGFWTKGPVDAFKARCSATLFAILADNSGDTELCQASVSVVDMFDAAGGITYAASNAGEAGYSSALAGKTINLAGPDDPTMKVAENFLGSAVSWSDVKKCSGRKPAPPTPVSQKYVCHLTTHQCVPDRIGDFTDMTTCQNACSSKVTHV